MSSSNYFTPSRLANLQLTPPHSKEHPQPHWRAWITMKSSLNCITRISLPLLSAHVIPQILQTQSLHGLLRSCIGSQVVVDSATTSILSSHPKMVYSLTVVNSRRQSALMQQFPRPHVESQLIAHCLNISTSSTLTSHLGIVSQLADSNTLLSSLTGQLATTGVLGSSLSTTMILLQPSCRSGQKPAASPVNSGATAMINYLAATCAPSSILTTLPSWPVLLDASRLMVLLNRTGKLWCICPGPT